MPAGAALVSVSDVGELTDRMRFTNPLRSIKAPACLAAVHDVPVPVTAAKPLVNVAVPVMYCVIY
jgi:hypothetical protein